MISPLQSLSLFMLLAMPLTSACSQPKGRYQAAVIIDDSGTLCMKVNDSKESRRYHPILSVVDVYERRTDGALSVWQQGYAAQRVQPVVSPEDCVARDALEANPFPVFSVGKRYTVVMTGGIVKEDGRAESRVYRGYFCMIESEGKPRVHQVLFDRRRQVWAWDACSASARSM